jgi:hypothetical protein
LRARAGATHRRASRVGDTGRTHRRCYRSGNHSAENKLARPRTSRRRLSPHSLGQRSTIH